MFVYIYNILVIHTYIECEQFPSNIWDWCFMEQTAYYTIGGVAYSLYDIHHGLLRHNKPSPFSQSVPFYDTDPRKTLMQSIVFNPCTLFTLSNHTLYVFLFQFQLFFWQKNLFVVVIQLFPCNFQIELFHTGI
jgi:hypothetical protein